MNAILADFTLLHQVPFMTVENVKRTCQRGEFRTGKGSTRTSRSSLLAGIGTKSSGI